MYLCVKVVSIMKRLLLLPAAMLLLAVVSAQPNRQPQKSPNPEQRAANAAIAARWNQFSRKWLDIPYATASEAQKLDIYLPEKGNGPFPVMVWIHGGGWQTGDKRSGNPAWLDNGFAFVTINYRLSGEATFPAQIYDVKAAIRWVKANAAKYSLDPDRVIVGGGSAGGHLSSLAATSGGAKELEDLSMGNAGFSSEVRGCYDLYGPINFLEMDKFHILNGKEQFQHQSQPGSATSNLIGGLITENPEKVRQADPTTYISATTPPFFIVQGSDDPTVPVKGSEKFADDLRKAIGSDKVELVVIKGAGHGGDQRFNDPELNRRAVAFFEKFLK